MNVFDSIINLVLRKDQNDCFQRLFKYPPIETPLILVNLGLKIKDQLFSKLERRKSKQINGNNNKESKKIEKPKKEIPTLVNEPDKTVVVVKEKSLIERINENEDDKEVLMLKKLEDIFIKYANIFEEKDKSDFKIILDTFKSNLNE